MTERFSLRAWAEKNGVNYNTALCKRRRAGVGKLLNGKIRGVGNGWYLTRAEWIKVLETPAPEGGKHRCGKADHP